MKENIGKNKLSANFGIIITQTVFCVLILIIILIVKFFGGTLSQDFTKWYSDNIKDKTNINDVLETNAFSFNKQGVLVNGSKTNDSAFIVPLNSKGIITSQYGYRQDPINGEYKMHDGLDIAAEKGSDILSVCDGVVHETGFEAGYGNYIIIEHANGFNTLYGHCESIVAKTGDTVKQGDVIATVGSTGRSTGNHLHFEVRKENSRVNPLWIIG